MNIYYNVLSMEERAASAGGVVTLLISGAISFPSHRHEVLMVCDKNNFYYGEKKKKTYRNFHKEKKKRYRCKFKTNKLNAQLGHVCFVFFCFYFSLSTVCPFLLGGGEDSPDRCAFMSSA